MATNKYFNHIAQQNEQRLFRDLVTEVIQMAGVNIVYLPRNNLEIDEILGEPKQSNFEKYYEIEAYMPDNGQFSGEHDIMGKFGYQIEQRTEFHIAEERWEQLGTGMVRPREGDLIYVGDISGIGKSKGSFINTFLQINQIWYGEPDWQHGKHFVYRLSCKTYVHGHERFETGNTELDQMNKESEEDILVGINEASKRMSEDIIVDRKNPFGDF